MAVPKSKKSQSKSKIKRFKKQQLKLKNLRLCQVCGNYNQSHICESCVTNFKQIDKI